MALQGKHCPLLLALTVGALAEDGKKHERVQGQPEHLEPVVLSKLSEGHNVAGGRVLVVVRLSGKRQGLHVELAPRGLTSGRGFRGQGGRGRLGVALAPEVTASTEARGVAIADRAPVGFTKAHRCHRLLGEVNYCIPGGLSRPPRFYVSLQT